MICGVMVNNGQPYMQHIAQVQSSDGTISFDTNEQGILDKPIKIDLLHT